MRRAWIAGLGLLGGCIPSVDPPARSSASQAPRAQYPAPPYRDGRSTEVQTLPAAPPAWEARPAPADGQTIEGAVHVVRAGESLRRIADGYRAGMETIAKANAISPPYIIHVGQRLMIPGGRYHLVRSGQSGIAIARAYGVPWSQIIAANGLSEPYILRAGQRVLIPGPATRSPATSAAERAAAFTLDIDSIITGGEPAIAESKRPAPPVAAPRRPLPATEAVAPPASSPGRFTWPVDGQVVRRFGSGGEDRNDGIKIAAPPGTPVRAVADGTVAYVGDGIAALGGLVIVRHGDGWTSVYGHASSLKVQRGQAVKRGQTLALSGQTGSADRPEVHFELRKGRTPVDPLTQLPSGR